MSKACPHFLAYTFLHWLVAVILTGAGTQVNLIPVENKGVSLLTVIGLLAVVIIQGFLPPGILKYLKRLTDGSYCYGIRCFCSNGCVRIL